MRSDDAIDMDSGPRVPKMYRLAVEYLAETEGVPMTRIYQDALDALIATRTWALKDLQDYYGRRADDLDIAMTAMKQRGTARALADRRANVNASKTA